MGLSQKKTKAPNQPKSWCALNCFCESSVQESSPHIRKCLGNVHIWGPPSPLYWNNSGKCSAPTACICMWKVFYLLTCRRCLSGAAGPISLQLQKSSTTAVSNRFQLPKLTLYCLSIKQDKSLFEQHSLQQVSTTVLSKLDFAQLHYDIICPYKPLIFMCIFLSCTLLCRGLFFCFKSL